MTLPARAVRRRPSPQMENNVLDNITAITPLGDFYAARSRMIRAWSGWLASKPCADDLAEELDGTASALRQVRDLAVADA